LGIDRGSITGGKCEVLILFERQERCSGVGIVAAVVVVAVVVVVVVVGVLCLGCKMKQGKYEDIIYRD
jgi:hypothetical protein